VLGVTLKSNNTQLEMQADGRLLQQQPGGSWKDVTSSYNASGLLKCWRCWEKPTLTPHPRVPDRLEQ